MAKKPWADLLQSTLDAAAKKVAARPAASTAASTSRAAAPPELGERPSLPPLRDSPPGSGRARLEERKPVSWWPLWILGGLAVLGVARSFVVVSAGERAVVFNRFSGVQKGALGEGLHLLLPFVQYVTIYDVKTHTYTMSASKSEANVTIGDANDALSALTRDGLPVSLEMSVQFHVDPDKVDVLHQDLGPQYIDKVVRPVTRSHVRMVVAKYPVTAVYGAGRAKIGEEIDARLRRLFARSNIVLESALLRDVSFSPQFQGSIEQKQVAQQEVARMAFVVERADKERRRKIIQAEGEAESIRLKARALARNPGLTQYEYVQNLPPNVRTIVTDGRTIVNIGEADASTSAAATLPNPAPTALPAESEQ